MLVPGSVSWLTKPMSCLHGVQVPARDQHFPPILRGSACPAGNSPPATGTAPSLLWGNPNCPFVDATITSRDSDFRVAAQASALTSGDQRLGPRATNQAIFAASFGGCDKALGQIGPGRKDVLGAGQDADAEAEAFVVIRSTSNASSMADAIVALIALRHGIFSFFSRG